MRKIVVLSGKGGVGKSSMTASLAVALSENHRIVCADCDVDASNLSLVLGAGKPEEWRGISTNEKAVFDHAKCTSCRRCMDECYFDAIKWVDNKPVLKDHGCEGCGLCKLVCPAGAVELAKVENAKIGYSRTKYGFLVASAQLEPGASGSGKVVSAVRKKAEDLSLDAEIMLIDSAAGIGCPVIASVTGTDYALIITEPSLSGMSDMKRAASIVRHFRIPYGIIINKHDINPRITKDIKEYAGLENSAVIAEIPFDRRFPKALNEMRPVIETEGYRDIFHDIRLKLEVKTRWTTKD